MSEYLFPQRLTRRDFFRWTGAASMAAGLADSGALTADTKEAPVKIGSGKFTYTLDEAAAALREMHPGQAGIELGAEELDGGSLGRRMVDQQLLGAFDDLVLSDAHPRRLT